MLSNFKYFSSFSPGSFGIIISFATLIISVIASIVCQHYVATRYINTKGWIDDCPVGYEDRCKRNSSVFRFSCALTILFGSQAIGLSLFGVDIGNRYFDHFWIVKFFCYVGTIIGFFFLPATIFDDHGYAWFARIAAALFVVYQQIILIDASYVWNTLWVEYSGGDSESLSLWLMGLITISFFLFAGSISAIGVMFWQFTGCAENNAIISLTLCLCTVATLIQVFLSTNGTLLTSAFVTAYCTFLCYSAVSLNPDPTCNPTIATSYQILTEIIGMTISVLSISYTTYSAVRQVVKDGKSASDPEHAFSSVEAAAVAQDQPNRSTAEAGSGVAAAYASEELWWKLQYANAVFLVVSSYYAMVLTDWATLQQGSASADLKAGRVGMWIQVRGG